MGTAIKYLEDVNQFEAFLELEKEFTKKTNNNSKVNPLHPYKAMKGLLFDLAQELKNKYK